MFSTPKPTNRLIEQTIAPPAALLRSDAPKSGTFADLVAYSFDYNRDRIRLRFETDGYEEVGIDWTNCHLCGERAWWVCGHRGQRRRALYLPTGAQSFGCRVCFRLTYVCQRLRPLRP